MGITSNVGSFTNSIEAIINGKFGRIEQMIVNRLAYLGEKCVNHARSVPNKENGGKGFTDQTGNLRSSIGYKVIHDGQVMAEGGYQSVLNGNEGVQAGQSLADLVAQTSGGDQYMLVVTAGMHYAVFVEAKGYDVLTSSEQLAREEWPKTQQQLSQLIKEFLKNG